MESGRLCISLVMKKACLLYICVLVAGSVPFAGCGYRSDSVLPFIRRVTGISLPGTVSIVSEFDQGEFEAVGKYRLEQKDVGAFLSSHPFHPFDQAHRYISRFNHYTSSGLIPLSDTIPRLDTASLQYFTGCKEGNAWLFTLNEKTGELWVEIQYPDFGGQGPGCRL